MGRKVKEPRYHVLSFRVSTPELDLIEQARGGKHRCEYLHDAVLTPLTALPAPLSAGTASDHHGGAA